MRTEPGNFIVLEGIDGSGKSTQVRKIIERWSLMRVPFYETREPTQSQIGKLIRTEYLSGNAITDERVLCMLFAADRLDHITNTNVGLKSKLNEGINVIMDRYYLSSIAYQGYTTSLDFAFQCNRINIDTLKPTVTIFISIEPEEAIERINKNRKNKEIFEDVKKLSKIKDMYLQAIDLLSSEGDNITFVDGNGSIEEVSERVWEVISHLRSK
jgi:dTMP kinase